jgi:hypothetical protein
MCASTISRDEQEERTTKWFQANKSRKDNQVIPSKQINKVLPRRERKSGKEREIRLLPLYINARI